MPLHLGRKPREFRPQIPHYSALIHSVKQNLVTPDNVDYTHGMPKTYGMYENDTVGDCTAAAYYHARQVWTYNAKGVEKSEPASDAIKLYSESAGYVLGNDSTDQGATCQQVLTFLHVTGAPVGGKGQYRDKILSFVEIDPRNLDDVKVAIWQTGLVYIGFRVPAYIMEGDSPPAIWRLSNQNNGIVGGHCVVLPGFSQNGYFSVISWGKRYLMDRNFFEWYVDECYAMIDINWVQGTGKTLLGLTIPELEKQMWAL